jgi:putative sterol carrier protein
MAERGSARWLEADDLPALDAAELAQLVDRTSERELRQRLIGGVREAVLGEIFRRIPQYLRPTRAGALDAVVGWQITGARGGGFDEFRIRIRDGRCSLVADHTGAPTVSVRTDPATFLKLVTGTVDPVTAVLKQRLSVRGDLALAARLTKIFAVARTTTR